MATKANALNYFTGAKGHPVDKIIINELADTAKEGRFFSLNGYAFNAPEGVEIEIQRPVRKMLDNRIETQSRVAADGKNYHKDIKRITYQLIEEDIYRDKKVETQAGA